MRYFRFLAWTGLLLVLTLAVRSAKAQDDPNFETGIKPFGVYHGGNIDTIDLSNGSLSVDIPLISYPQRGQLKLDFVLHYENKGSYVDELCADDGYGGCETYYYAPGMLNHGFNIIQKGVPSALSMSTVYSGTEAAVSAYIKMTDGPEHDLEPTTASSANWESVDASGIQASGSGVLSYAGAGFPALVYGTVIDSDGIRYAYSNVGNIPGPNRTTDLIAYNSDIFIPTTIQDRNGNTITASFDTSTSAVTGWSDSAERTIPAPEQTTDSEYTSKCPTTPSAVWIWSLPGYSSDGYPLIFCSITVPEYVSIYGFTIVPAYSATELQAVILPNNTMWQFSYTSDGNGDLSMITFPTGGTLSYTWTSAGTLVPTHTYVYDRSVAARILNPGGGGSTEEWDYAYSLSATYGSSLESVSTTVTANPSSEHNDTVHTFAPVLTGCSGQSQLYETSAMYFQGSSTSGTLLKTVNTVNDCPSFVGTAAPIRTTTIWPSGQQSKVENDYDAGFSWRIPTYSIGGYYYPTVNGGTFGKVVATREYDYGSGSPGSLLRVTYPVYNAFSTSSFLNANMLNQPSEITVEDGSSTVAKQTVYSYDESPYAYCSTAPCGQLTTVTQYVDSSNTLATHTYYNPNGMPTSVKDPALNVTNYSYDSATEVFVSEIDYPTTGSSITHTETFSHDPNTGLLTAYYDQNSQPTYYSYDNMLRLTGVTYPDGGSESYSYHDTTPTPWFVFTKAIDSSTTLTRSGVMDGLGRPIQKSLEVPTSTCSGNYTFVNISYDAEGRQSFESNPDCSSGTTTGTSYQYDTLNRVTKIIPADGSSSSDNIAITYPGNCATKTDEAGKVRKSCSDGLGRMTGVWEDPSGLNYETDYSYDPLDDLTGVTQSSSRSRTFAYDFLGRLTSASNPETGTTSYKYDSNSTCSSPNSFPGDLVSKTDARSIRTCMQYDALHRLTDKNYTDGTPEATFTYDISSLRGVTISNPIGRLVTADTYASSTNFSYIMRSYDPMGRVNIQWQWNPAREAQTYEAFVVYAWYNLLGLPITYTNDSTSSATYFYVTYDLAGTPTGITRYPSDSYHPSTLVSGVVHTPTGGIAQMNYYNGLTSTRVYNSRWQPCRFNVNSSSTDLTTCTGTPPSGNVQDFQFGFNYGSSDNGNLASMAATGHQSFTRSYTYDGVNRLYTMSASSDPSGCTGLSWTYDAWGDRTAQTVTGGTCGSWSAGYSSSNRVTNTGFSYDAAGNMTGDGVHNYYYDAENQLIQVDGTLGTCSTATACYLYDAEGHRVQRTTSGGTTAYVYDIVSGNVLEETNGSDTLQSGYVYLDGQLVSVYADGTTYFAHPDHLGSTRLLTDLSGAVTECDDFQPFGEQLSYSGGSYPCVDSATTTHKFTGKERETTLTLDYFGARYYSFIMGRFMTPDWSAKIEPVPYSKLDNPQSLNLYGYVLNNPLSQKDDDGHDIIFADGLKNAQLVRDSVTALLANPNTGGYLSGYVGPNAPNLIIQSGDLGPPTVEILPNGQTLTTTVQGNTAPDIQTGTFTENGVTTSQTTLTGATITIDNNTSKGDTPGVMTHESVHAGEALKDPSKFAADAKTEKSLPHDQRPQEQRANAVRKANEKDIIKAVRQIERDRKKEQFQ